MKHQSGSSQDITVLGDDKGLLILGDENKIQALLDERGLTSRQVTSKALAAAGTAMQTASNISLESGRWVKLTEESADLLKKYAKPDSLQKGVAQKSNGEIVKWLEFQSPSDLLNPAAASGVAGIMTQIALEQAVKEITDYLETMDSKIDDLLQDQKDRTIADLIGAVLEVDEAMAIRDSTGKLDATAWSKVAPCATTTNTALGYALTKLENVADKLNAAASFDQLEDAVFTARQDVPAWLSIIARSVQTRDKISVVELESVFAEDPESIEGRRVGIIEARKHRLENVQKATDALQASLETSAAQIRDEKLLHPFKVDKSIGSLAQLMKDVSEFSASLELEASEHEIEQAKRWRAVAGETFESVASNAALLGGQITENAAEIGRAAAKGVGDVAESAGKGAAALGTAAMQGAQDLGQKLKSIEPPSNMRNSAHTSPFFDRRRKDDRKNDES